MTNYFRPPAPCCVLTKNLVWSALVVALAAAMTTLSAQEKGGQRMLMTEARLNAALPTVSQTSRARLLDVLNRQDFGGRILKSTADGIQAIERCSLDELMLKLLPLASGFAQPKVSQYHVGIIGLGSSGDLYLGANIEMPGEHLGLTVHGEQATIANALMHGEDDVVALALTAAPCGHCRQFLYEMHNGAELRILIAGKPATTLETLLPDPFGPHDLGLKSALFKSSRQKLLLDSESSELLAISALDACTKSYAPYTHSYSSIGIRARDGRIYTGCYIENAAYNPSLSPLQAACVSMVFSGATFSDIAEVVLIELSNTTISQESTTRVVLNAIAPKAELKVMHATLAK